MQTSLVALPETPDNTRIIVPERAIKDEKHRLAQFAAWLNATSRSWISPDLDAYRDHLLSRGLARSSVKAHLSTIRGRYTSLLRDRDAFYALTPPEGDTLHRKAFVDEAIARLQNAIAPEVAAVKTTTQQDRPDSSYCRLSATQANALMAAPGVDSLVGLRDTTLLALMLCTGLREAELCALELPDLRQRLGGALALHVREGKGAKERLIPYGSLDWVLVIADAWLRTAEIEQGPVFRGFYKGGQRLRPGRLTERAVQDILSSYPISLEGQLVHVKPHDLRRTYARRLFEAGVELLAIQQNLGHSDVKTTLLYIGELHVDTRKPPAIYSFDLSVLG